MTPDIEIAERIEALLFALGEPLAHAELAHMLEVGEENVRRAVLHLQTQGREARRGIVLIDDGREVALRAAPEAAGLIERVRKEAYDRDIGRAGLEALAAILYRGPLSRSQIDFIRGVNSSQTLRTLAMRGLVRKLPNPRDERSYLYEPTTEALAELGITRASELPDFEDITKKLAALEAEQTTANS